MIYVNDLFELFKVATKVDKYLKEFGYDAAPFLPKWYNDLSTIVKLDYAPNTGFKIYIFYALIFCLIATG